ncbi:MAG: hypothetical protein ACRC30_08320 [Clostridium sp.]
MNFLGMLVNQDLIKEKKIDYNGFHYDEPMEYYINLLNKSRLLHDEYYRAYSNNDQQNTEHYSKEIEKTTLKINDFETRFPWVSQEINRYST